MKRSLRTISLSLAACVLAASLTVPAGAALTAEQITIQNGANLYVAGKPYQAADVTGKEVTPFFYHGTTYVPVRAVSDMFGATITYDQAQERVVISSLFTAEPVNQSHGRTDTSVTSQTVTAYRGVEVFVGEEKLNLTDAKGQAVEALAIDGTVYVPARAMAGLFGVEITWVSEGSRVYIGEIPEQGANEELAYPYLSAQLNEDLQRYKDSIESVEPVIGTVLPRQEAYRELYEISTAYEAQVRTALQQAIAAGAPAERQAALQTALAGLHGLSVEFEDLTNYISLMCGRFGDAKAYIEKIPADVKPEELDEDMLYNTCGTMLDTAYNARARLVELTSEATILRYQQKLNEYYAMAFPSGT